MNIDPQASPLDVCELDHLLVLLDRAHKSGQVRVFVDGARVSYCYALTQVERQPADGALVAVVMAESMPPHRPLDPEVWGIYQHIIEVRNGDHPS